MWLREKLFKKSKGGRFEEELERDMREIARESFGINVADDVFAG